MPAFMTMSIATKLKADGLEGVGLDLVNPVASADPGSYSGG
jgi:hypothetical protein